MPLNIVYNFQISPLEIFSLLDLEARELALNKHETEFINLREAAEISGYAPDYVGQLIRSGKLRGKQVFSNVSWVTTREAIEEYLQKEKKGMTREEIQKSASRRLHATDFISKAYTVAGWTLVVVLAAFLFLLVYIFAVSVDHRINANYLEKIEYAR